MLPVVSNMLDIEDVCLLGSCTSTEDCIGGGPVDANDSDAMLFDVVGTVNCDELVEDNIENWSEYVTNVIWGIVSDLNCEELGVIDAET